MTSACATAIAAQGFSRAVCAIGTDSTRRPAIGRASRAVTPPRTAPQDTPFPATLRAGRIRRAGFVVADPGTARRVKIFIVEN